MAKVVMGPCASYAWRDDPRHLLFTMARYKFVAKMLSGRQKVLEIGCGDGFFSPIVLQEVGQLVCVEQDSAVIPKRPGFYCRDATRGQLPRGNDAAFCLDMIEHIDPAKEPAFMGNVSAALLPDGVFIVGTPNKMSQTYASKASLRDHINLHTDSSLRGMMKRYFRNTFSFSMNDEVVHTGYAPMAHYLFCMGVGKQ